MVETPWLTIVGLGEDGAEGLASASRQALDEAEIVVGPERHQGLLPDLKAERILWPRPFSDGLPEIERLRGRRVVALVTSDPFWFGAGGVLAKLLAPGEWRALPAPSTFSLAAARLGWPLQRTVCAGLHAAPLERLTPSLAPGVRLIVLLRDGEAPARLARFLTERGFGASRLIVMEAIGGPRERVRETTAETFDLDDMRHPVCAAIEARGGEPLLHRASGQADDVFEHDGQITKRPVRALTLSALAPRPGARLWDIGAGAGSVAIEWLLSAPDAEATAVEARPDRAERIRRNADRLGCDRLVVKTGKAPDALDGLPPPDAVFIGGGLSEALLAAVWARLPQGGRIVANAVTLESEALLTEWHGRVGGELLRIELSAATPLGSRRGWQAARPIVQWSARR